MLETEALILGNKLLAFHLNPNKWSFGFDHAKRRAGACHYGPHRITISKYFVQVAGSADVAQVILHEIAHAIVGPGHGHNKLWKTTAAKIGYTGGRTIEHEFAKGMATWIGVCPAGHTHERYRIPKKDVSCGVCNRGFSRNHLIAWRKR